MIAAFRNSDIYWPGSKPCQAENSAEKKNGEIPWLERLSKSWVKVVILKIQQSNLKKSQNLSFKSTSQFGSYNKIARLKKNKKTLK